MSQPREVYPYIIMGTSGAPMMDFRPRVLPADAPEKNIHTPLEVPASDPKESATGPVSEQNKQAGEDPPVTAAKVASPTVPGPKMPTPQI